MLKSNPALVSAVGVPANETLLDMEAPLGLPKGATAKRRFIMDTDSATVTIADTLTGLKPGDTITWNMMTRANVSRVRGSMELASENKRLALHLFSPQAKSANTAPADPPPARHDNPNLGITRISLNATAGNEGKIEITAVFRGMH